MSYEFGMCFKKVRSKKAAFEFALKFTNKCYEKVEEIIDLEKHYIPTYRKYMFGEKAYEFNEVDRFWLYDVFNIRFIYWDKYKILGIVGDNYPKELLDMVDTTVYFQNACDQDYDYEIWGRKIPTFNITRFFYTKLTAKQLLKIMNKNKSNYSLEEIKENIEYYRKSALYNKIYNKLSLDLWLYKKVGPFETFALNSIDNNEKLMDTSIIVRRKLLELKKEDETFLTEMKTKKENE